MTQASWPRDPHEPYGPPLDGDPVYVEQPYPYTYPSSGAQYPAYPYAWAPPPGPPAPPERLAPPSLGYGVLTGAVVIVVAAFLPWADVFGVSVKGTDGTGDGNWTLFLGMVIGVMGLLITMQRGRVWTSIVACAATGLVLVTAFKDLTDVNGFANANGLDPSAVRVGPGLWLTLLAGLLSLGFAIAGLTGRPRA